MKKIKATCTLLLLALIGQSQLTGSKVLFNDGWLFAREEFRDASKAIFNDLDWRKVTLPHDWAIEGPFAEEFGPRSGGLPIYGTGWYRKKFFLPSSLKEKQTLIHFDGAMNNAEVFVNGVSVGKRPYGYSSFQVDISSQIQYGKENVVAVKLAPEELSSRWYPGAGLYRNVWIEHNDPLHFTTWGTGITTPEADAKRAVVLVNTNIHHKKGTSNAQLEITLLDPNGKQVGKIQEALKPSSVTQTMLEKEFTLNNPLRWDTEKPNLYKAVLILKYGNRITDVDTVSFGIRTIQFTPDGFLLNGKPLRFKGVCMHSDLGPLGAVVNYRGLERQLEIMKNMGANAIRTSHNPTSPEQLDICDKLGILVIEEAFDCWQMPKIPNDYSKHFDEWHERDLRDMIRRDRNHPSIIMWSIGNEILEQNNKTTGAQIAASLTKIIHDEDPTRPSTAGFNNHRGAMANGLAAAVDVVGFNYKPALYDSIRKAHPNWIVYGSETESTVSSRGIYHFPVEKYEKHPSRQLTGYDLIGPPWAYPPDIEFYFQKLNPSILGEFVWTGFDYLGEPTPYGGKDNDTQGGWKGDWVSRSSYFGIVDLAGFPKDRYYLYQSEWSAKPMVHLYPHWNWQTEKPVANFARGEGKKGMEGNIIPVVCYTNGDEAELFLNGKSFGRKRKGVDLTEIPVRFSVYKGPEKFASPYRISWDVPYEPGTLKVVAYKNGKEHATTTLTTAGKPSRIKLIPDKKILSADGYDLSYITVRIEDKDGNLCPTADNLVRFGVEGSAVFEAVGNGNAATTLLFQEPYRPAFNGLCMLIVRSKRGDYGKALVRAKSEGLEGTTVELEVNK